MSTPAATTPPRTRKRARTALRAEKHHPEPDGSLPLALSQLEDAVAALCDPRPYHLNGHTTWLASRYHDLRDAISTTSVAGHHRNTPSSLIPCQIDCLKLVMEIDAWTAQLDAAAEDTPTRLQHVLEHPWRPQDTDYMNSISKRTDTFVKAVDDLFSPKPIYLPNDPCPRCGRDHTYKLNDEGERVRVVALAITADRGAVCNSCHDFWPPSELLFLGRLLGYHPEGITA